MAPMRGDRGGSPARAARASLPLSRRLIRQIAQHVASSGRSLRRLEVSGRVIDNFDDIDAMSDDDINESPVAVACGGNSGNLPPADHDDDLTSLSWLQDRNLLRGINLTKGDALLDGQMIPSHIIVKTERALTPPPAPAPPPQSPPRPHKAPPSPPSPPPAPPSPPLSKPPYSFSCLIFMAIEAAPARALPVKEIYAWIVAHFPYFRHAPQGWKNSVRHNLSLNKCFHKVGVAAAPGLGKGSLWTVDPQHRNTLIQAFGRQPPPPAASPPPPAGPAAPDPALFPFLSRRLAGHVAPASPEAPACTPPPAPGADEYLAAATVLAMKYGGAVLDQLPPSAHLVISRCTRDEHSYSGGGGGGAGGGGAGGGGAERRTAEALLNLAGVRGS